MRFFVCARLVMEFIFGINSSKKTYFAIVLKDGCLWGMLVDRNQFLLEAYGPYQSGELLYSD